MCDHRRLKCTNCELICMDCGAMFPNGIPIEETAEKPAATVANNATAAKKKGAKAK